LNTLKGADLLPEILHRAQVNLKLLVVGSGELEPALTREPGMELRGWLSNSAALQLLSGARVLLFPSRWAEPLARTLLEAQALGVPTVALDTGGTRDIIESEVNGLLTGSVEEFSAQLSRLASDDALCDRLSRAAKQVAETRFAGEVVAGQVEAVYRRVLGMTNDELPEAPLSGFRITSV
jgi:glycosyltransferase involved in cell wall biosynthesis